MKTDTLLSVNIALLVARHAQVNIAGSKLAVAPKWRMSGENDVLSTFTAHSWYQRKTLLAGQHTNSLTKNKAFLFLLLSSAILKSLLILRKQIKGNLPG